MHIELTAHEHSLSEMFHVNFDPRIQLVLGLSLTGRSRINYIDSHPNKNIAEVNILEIKSRCHTFLIEASRIEMRIPRT